MLSAIPSLINEISDLSLRVPQSDPTTYPSRVAASLYHRDVALHRRPFRMLIDRM